jgi:hypothetical protein
LAAAERLADHAVSRCMPFCLPAIVMQTTTKADMWFVEMSPADSSNLKLPISACLA